MNGGLSNKKKKTSFSERDSEEARKKRLAFQCLFFLFLWVGSLSQQSVRLADAVKHLVFLLLQIQQTFSLLKELKDSSSHLLLFGILVRMPVTQ